MYIYTDVWAMIIAGFCRSVLDAGKTASFVYAIRHSIIAFWLKALEVSNLISFFFVEKKSGHLGRAIIKGSAKRKEYLFK